MSKEEETLIISSLSTLPPPHLSALSSSVLSVSLRYHLRLSTLLSSPSSFSLSLHHLLSLPFPLKSLLIARHLLSSLHLITRHLHPPPPPPPHSTSANHRDLDAALLLLLLCETHQHHPHALDTHHSQWRQILTNIYSHQLLNLNGITGNHNGAVLMFFIEMVIRCKNFVETMGCGGKEGREVGAATTAVVGLPAVEVRGGEGKECVICREAMREGRDACELPCQHLFHWICILPWLKKRNTCPCCRFQLPSDDVFAEIQRLWRVLVKAGEN